jgi:hypothetical protein
MTNQFDFYPVSDWLRGDPIVLPSNIQYSYLPVSPQNARPDTLENNTIYQNAIIFFELLLHPEIFAVILVVAALLVIIALIVRKSTQPPKADS